MKIKSGSKAAALIAKHLGKRNARGRRKLKIENIACGPECV